MQFMNDQAQYNVGQAFKVNTPIMTLPTGKNLHETLVDNLNENLNKEAITEIRLNIDSMDRDINIYPDPFMTQLRESLASYHKVEANAIVCGAGSDEILDLLVRLFAPKAIFSCPPTFGMYKFLSDVNAAKLIEVKRGPAPNFNVDVSEVVKAIRSVEGSKILFLASPNNPTGGVLSNIDVETLCSENCIVVMDEAYVDFVSSRHNPEGSLDLYRSGRFPNLVILRTFSKWAGLAGLRIGYGIMHTEVAARIMQIKQPYNVNVAAAVAAET
jgi:histidinol-phosphate aminotransferase